MHSAQDKAGDGVALGFIRRRPEIGVVGSGGGLLQIHDGDVRFRGRASTCEIKYVQIDS